MPVPPRQPSRTRVAGHHGSRGPHTPRDALAMLRALIAGLSASARTVERRTGITNAQLFLLQALAADGPRSLGALAELARTHDSTVSVVIGRLQRAGLVTREKAPDDRRRVVIRVTGAGRRLVRRAPVAPMTRLLGAMTSLPPKEIRSLEAGLAPLLSRLGITWAGSPLLFEPPVTTGARPRAR